MNNLRRLTQAIVDIVVVEWKEWFGPRPEPDDCDEDMEEALEILRERPRPPPVRRTHARVGSEG